MIIINNCFIKDIKTNVIDLVCEVLDGDIKNMWEGTEILASGGVWLITTDEKLYSQLKAYSYWKDKDES